MFLSPRSLNGVSLTDRNGELVVNMNRNPEVGRIPGQNQNPPFWAWPAWGRLPRWSARRWWGWAAPGWRTPPWSPRSSPRWSDSCPEPAPGPGHRKTPVSPEPPCSLNHTPLEFGRGDSVQFVWTSAPSVSTETGSTRTVQVLKLKNPRVPELIARGAEHSEHRPAEALSSAFSRFTEWQITSTRPPLRGMSRSNALWVNDVDQLLWCKLRPAWLSFWTLIWTWARRQNEERVNL